MRVFPARAGMSPAQNPLSTSPRRVPRASGDEPVGILYLTDDTMCSPRERG